MDKKVIALTKNGWEHVQLDNVVKVQKAWTEEREGYTAECRADAYFGTLRNGSFTPAVIMNVYEQGAGSKYVVDDNCDIWKNMFASTTKEEGNEYYKYLLKHGFRRVQK